MGDIRPPAGDPLLKAGCLNPYNRQLGFGTSRYYPLYCPNAIGINSFLNQTNSSPYFTSYMDTVSMNYYSMENPDYIASFKYYADSMSLYINSYLNRIDLSSNDTYSYISTSNKSSNISAELVSDGYGGQVYIQSNNSNTFGAIDAYSDNVNMQLTNGTYNIQNSITNSNAISYITNGSTKSVSISLADLGTDSSNIRFRNCGSAGNPLWILTNKTFTTGAGSVCWASYNDTTDYLTIGNSDCPVVDFAVIGNGSDDEGVFLEKKSNYSQASVYDATSARLQAYTSTSIKAYAEATSNASTIGAQASSTSYAKNVANSNGGYFEAFAGTKQILLNANTLSANQALTLRNWGSVAAPIYVASTEVVNLSKVTGQACWASYNDATDYLTIGNSNCPVVDFAVIGNGSDDKGVFLEKKSTYSQASVYDAASARLQAYTSTSIKAYAEATSNASTIGAQASSTSYAKNVANSNGGYFEAFAGTKQILLNANTLSANQALTLRNWGSVAAPIYVASTEVVNLSKVTGQACWASYNDATDYLTIGNSNCPVLTMYQSYDNTTSNGAYLTTQADRSEIYVLKNDTFQCTMRAEGASSFIKAQGGIASQFSQMYSDGSSATVYAQGSASVKSRLGATSTTSDLQVYNAFGGIYATTEAENAYLRVQNSSSSKQISLSIADFGTTAATTVKLREFSICANGETKKCLILASEFYV